MTTILALLGLISLCVACVGTGMYVAGVRRLPTVTVDAAPTPREPRGLVVTNVSHIRREVYFIADKLTADRLRSFGKVFTDYTDHASGDRHWILYGSELRDWNEVLAAMGLHGGAVDAPRIASPVKSGAIVKHQGWGQ